MIREIEDSKNHGDKNNAFFYQPRTRQHEKHMQPYVRYQTRIHIIIWMSFNSSPQTT